MNTFEYLEGLRRKINRPIHDLQSLQHLGKLVTSYLPWTESALRPTACRLFLNEMLLNNRKTVLELGAGISTILLEAASRDNSDWTIYSVEHDAGWVEAVKNMIRSNGGDPSRVNFIVTGLKEVDTAAYKGPWYDTGKIAQALSAKVDLLLVDGPISYQNDPMIRFPALPELRQLMNEQFCVLLDDTSRKGEEKILALWAEKFGLHLRDFTLTANCAFLSKDTKTLYNIV